MTWHCWGCYKSEMHKRKRQENKEKKKKKMLICVHRIRRVL